MTCPVILHATGEPCGNDLPWNGAEVCRYHYHRRRDGWTDDELGLPFNATRKAPRHTQCCVTLHTGDPCPDEHFAAGYCSLHYHRNNSGWTADQLGLPRGRRRPTAPSACAVVMHDDDECGRPAPKDGMCATHARRVSDGWPEERLGEPFRGRARCGARTPSGPCPEPVAAHGDTCPDHHGSGVPSPVSAPRPGKRRPMEKVEDPRRADAEADAFVDRHRHAPGTTRGLSYGERWFRAWAERHDADPEPPVPFATFAQYLTSMTDPGELDPGRGRLDPFAFNSIRKARSAVRDMHIAAGVASPTDHAWMPALWTGLKRSLSTVPAWTVPPITVDMMRAVMAKPPAPSIDLLFDRALLHTVHHFDVAAQDLAGAAVTVRDNEVRVAGDGVDLRVPATDPAGVALVALVGTTDAEAWSWPDNGKRIASRQCALLDRAGFAASGHPSAVTVLDDDDLGFCLLRADRQERLWTRDRAFMLLAFHLGLEYHEWSPLRWDIDVVETDAGFDVIGPLRLGRPVFRLALRPARDPSLCAVRALTELRDGTRPCHGDLLFPSQQGHGAIPVSAQAANDRIKAALRRAHHDDARFGTSSLRYGFIVTAVRHGADEHDLVETARITLATAENHVRTIKAHDDAQQRMRRMTRDRRR